MAPVNPLEALRDIFSREFTRLYLKLADSARQQTNYAVAYKYLQLTESAIADVSRWLLQMNEQTNK